MPREKVREKLSDEEIEQIGRNLSGYSLMLRSRSMTYGKRQEG